MNSSIHQKGWEKALPFWGVQPTTRKHENEAFISQTKQTGEHLQEPEQKPLISSIIKNTNRLFLLLLLLSALPLLGVGVSPSALLGPSL